MSKAPFSPIGQSPEKDAFGQSQGRSYLRPNGRNDRRPLWQRLLAVIGIHIRQD